MDISKQNERFKKEIWFTPKFPNGEPCDCRFKITGRNTEEYKRVLHKNAVKQASGRKGAVEEVIGTSDMFVACVLDWDGITVDGEEHPCTKENKEKMHKDASFKWLVDQIEFAIIEDENFFCGKE